MRALSEHFMNDLKDPEGLLSPILERIKCDQTLLLAIRENYINVYYRGGNILKVTERKSGRYETYFDEKYSISSNPLPNLPKIIENRAKARQWVEALPALNRSTGLC